MENGKWKMENGKWKMENGKWKMENGKWKMENGKGQDGVEETGGKGVGGREGAEKALLSVLSKKEKGEQGKRNDRTDGGSLRCERGTTTTTTTTTTRKKRQEEDGSNRAARKRAPIDSRLLYIYISTYYKSRQVTFPLHLPLPLSILSRSKKKDLSGSLSICEMQNVAIYIARVLTSWG